jgi:hypothetical protein
MKTETVLRPSEAVKYRDLGDEFLFYDSRGDRLHVLNTSARAIFLLCDGTRTLEQVVDAFASQYEIDDGTARTDTQQIIDELMKLGILDL